MKEEIIKKTKNLTNQELLTRIERLKDWKVKGANDSVREYRTELIRRLNEY